MQRPPLSSSRSSVQPTLAPTRRFAWMLSGSTTIHVAVLGVASLLGGWPMVHDRVANQPAPRVVQPLTLARVDFQEVVEPETEVADPAPDPEQARLVEHELADAPAPREPELTDPLVGAMWVTEQLAWRVEPTEPVVDEPLPESTPPPVEPVPAEVEIALEAGPEVVAATVLEAPSPRYPRLSIRNGESGTVSCRLHVTAAGTVARVEVVRSSGFARLDRAAVEALLTWRFVARQEGGRAAATTILHPVTFVLEND